MTYPEILLFFRDFGHLLPELEGGQDGVLTGEGNVRLTGQSLIGLQAGLGQAQRVNGKLVLTVRAYTLVSMRLGNGIPHHQQHLNDLEVVPLSRQDDGSDVSGELRLEGPWRLVEEIVPLAYDFVLSAHVLIARMFEDDLGCILVVFTDGLQESLVDVVRAGLL